MTWLFRFSLIVCVLFVSLSACIGELDVGNPCKFTLEKSSENLKALGEKARIIEPSFACTLPYCIANFYDPDPKKEGLGYCTKICKQAGDCPSNFTCEFFVQVSNLPPEYRSSLTRLIDKKLCLQKPPQSTTDQ